MKLLSSTVSSAESLLQPYLTATLALTPSPPTTPLFTTFYIQHAPPPPPVYTNPSGHCTFLVIPAPNNLLPESADSAATDAETVFWEAVSLLKALPRHRDDESFEIDSFWPSQKSVAEEEVDEEW
jgi:Rab proteins geranylgeranyltransferase component A